MSNASRPSRLKSQIWLHFTAITGEKKVKCLYCEQILSVANRSTCSLIRHINKKHPARNIGPLANSTTISEYSVNNTPLNTQPSTTEGRIAKSGPHKVRKNLKESKKRKEFLLDKTLKRNKQQEIDRQLVRMITKDYYPFSFVEDNEFIKFVKLLNPAYQLPTRKTISQLLIPAIYQETVAKVKNRLERAFSVCLTADGWTSKTGEIIYAVTAHYIVENNEGMVLDNDLLGCISFTEHHTAENIAYKINEIMTEWQIVGKLTVIVSDNVASMKAAVLAGEWRHWSCFAHSLNRIAQAGIEEIKAVVNKIKILASYFNRNSQATDQLNDVQESMDLQITKLKNDVPTRWNSTFDMINRTLSVKGAIVSTMAVLKSSLLVENDEIQQVDVPSPNEWLIAEQAVQVLEVFDTLTSVIASESKITMSSIIIYLKQLKVHLNKCEMNRFNLMPEINNMVTRLLREINTQFFSERDHIEDNELIGFSTILDPRYKKLGFIDESKYEKMLETLHSKVTSMRPMETSENAPLNNQVVSNQRMNASSTCKADKLDDMLFKDFDKEVQKHLRPGNATASSIDEVDKYLQEPLLPRKDATGANTDPLLWWFQRKHIYPRLHQLVKTSLNIMSTSVPCERIFSQDGQIVNEKRINLKTSIIFQVVFLNHNFNDIS